jgi:hypothetical protein
VDVPALLRLRFGSLEEVRAWLHGALLSAVAVHQQLTALNHQVRRGWGGFRLDVACVKS